MTFYPMGAGALCMTLFALDLFRRRPARDIAVGFVDRGRHRGALRRAGTQLSPDTVPSSGDA